MDIALIPLASPRVSRHQIPSSRHGPNTSIQHRPLLIYHAAFAIPPASSFSAAAAAAASIESNLRSVGLVQSQSRYTMYDVSHFHSTTHEVLCGRFQLVGSYPPGEQWDMCYGLSGEEGRLSAIATLAWFQEDPIYGMYGPALVSDSV